MVFSAKKDIEAGTELTISYTDDGMKLLAAYGFECDCGACPDPVTDEKLIKFLKGAAERQW